MLPWGKGRPRAVPRVSRRVRFGQHNDAPEHPARAGRKKQTSLSSLAYAGILYQVFGERSGAVALMMAWRRSPMVRSDPLSFSTVALLLMLAALAGLFLIGVVCFFVFFHKFIWNFLFAPAKRVASYTHFVCPRCCQGIARGEGASGLAAGGNGITSPRNPWPPCRRRSLF